MLATRTNWAEPPKATAEALRRVAARSQAVLLSYWLARDRSYLWVITASGVHLLRLPAAAEIAALVRQYNGVIGDALADPIASPANAGDRLYDLLVKPASAWLPHGTRVILVADGALHGLNFETLPVAGATRHYWIEDVELQAAPGLAMLAAPRSSAAGPPSLLLMGDPVPRAAEFPALKYAGAEIANISKHFPNAAVVYTSAQASPAAYKEATPRRFSFVHFAAHASANLESPLDSAVILSGPDDAFKLYARDVADVPLRAELVTVSACRSAGERIYSGEGLVGFAWAFLRAGSSRVIAGLWDVDDRSTAELMDHLYLGLAAGHPPAQALRAAKLALLTKGANYSKPYYWGPFQLFTVCTVVLPRPRREYRRRRSLDRRHAGHDFRLPQRECANLRRRGAGGFRVGLPSRRRAPGRRRAVERRRSIDRGIDGRVLSRAGVRREPRRGAPHGEARHASPWRQLRQTGLLGAVRVVRRA